MLYMIEVRHEQTQRLNDSRHFGRTYKLYYKLLLVLLRFNFILMLLQLTSRYVQVILVLSKKVLCVRYLTCGRICTKI